MDAERPHRRGVAGDANVTHSHKSLHPTTNLLHLGAPLQYAPILDNERSLEGEATAETTDPL